jgi:hypothetical protein
MPTFGLEAEHFRFRRFADTGRFDACRAWIAAKV